ncbi:hypothetical protein PLICRDRAFT_108070 [Plicaturopsis crispa FD-325 SS-3]|nr:hypothetical protein PLICRDRAFT_108070 [Plicaturopsis crispa FD-325 SS-3]
MDIDTSPDTQEIRITSGGKIHAWVDFALKFLKQNETSPLVLHTLPAAKRKQPAGVTDELEGSTVQTEALPESAKRISPSTTTIPRLISVVEIIKREYLKTLDISRSETLLGLHQYNEVGCLEDIGFADDSVEEDAVSIITRALEGKNHLKIKKSPYMKVTLSRVKLGGLVSKSTTYQPPAKRTLSKSAKARARKRQKQSSATVGTIIT